jgi:hypothetical protein
MNRNVNRYADALAAFETAAECGHKGTGLWLRKCRAELALASTTSADKSATTAKTEETPAPAAAPTAKGKTTVSDAVDAATTKPAPPPMTKAERVRESWYQTAADVHITLFAKQLTGDDVVVTLGDDDGDDDAGDNAAADNAGSSVLKARLVMPDASVFTREWRLFATAAALTVNVTAYKVEITLSKSTATAPDWDSLERAEASSSSASSSSSWSSSGVQQRANTHTVGKAPSYPSSSKRGVEWSETVVDDEEDKPQVRSATPWLRLIHSATPCD